MEKNTNLSEFLTRKMEAQRQCYTIFNMLEEKKKKTTTVNPMCEKEKSHGKLETTLK